MFHLMTNKNQGEGMLRERMSEFYPNNLKKGNSLPICNNMNAVNFEN